MTAQKRCVFFDRDGIVNQSPGAGYVTSLAEFHLLPEFCECLKISAKRGYVAAIVTNQSAIAKGLLKRDTLEAIHAYLRRGLMQCGAPPLLDIIYCPHNPGECVCRKPQPGMLLALAEKHDINLAASWMVGDAESDVEAGRRAGCRTILVAPSEADRPARSNADYMVNSMRDLPALLKRVL